MPLLLAALPAIPLHAQLVSHDGFGAYAAAGQVETGANGSPGSGLDGGVGWGGPYDVNNAIKSLVRIEDRTASPVNYANGEVVISGGDRALRFYDVANGSYSLARPLGSTFHAASNDVVWFSALFRTAGGGASPLANQDFFQIGFDDNANAASGIPRVSIGANTTQATFPAPYRFFARSSTAVDTSAFYDGLSIAAVTTYLLVGRVQAHDGVYDTVSLFVNPSSLDSPGPASAEAVVPSGLTSITHAFIRTSGLDNGDAYVIDEWHVGRSYGSVVQDLRGVLRILPAATPEPSMILQWPASLGGVILESSATLIPDSWAAVSGTFDIVGTDRRLLLSADPAAPQRFFRLRR